METSQTRRSIRILVPEYVPLDNKGEEAIVRGYGDLLFPKAAVELIVLDRCDRPEVRDGIRVWPRRWFYAEWRTRPFSLSLAPRDLISSGFSALRHGLTALPFWARMRPWPVRRVSKAIRRTSEMGGRGCRSELERAASDALAADCVLAGHDGVFRTIDECHVLDVFHESGLGYGILGMALPIPLPFPHVREAFRKAFTRAKFVYTRSPHGARWAEIQFPNVEVRYAPDPAFALKPAPPGDVEGVIEEEGLQTFFESPVVMMSVCETEVSLRYGFPEERTAQGKRQAHIALLTRMVESLLERTKANVLFLPHCVGPRHLDDRILSRRVLDRVSRPAGRVRVLAGVYGARLLKGLLGRASMLVSERVHALIAAVGMGIPFLCVGAKADLRYESIIGAGCDCEDLICYLDTGKPQRVFPMLETIWASREELRQRVTEVAVQIQGKLDRAASEIRSRLIGYEATGEKAAERRLEKQRWEDS